MALSCECSDFDKGDAESWWEIGRGGLPPEGERCCECGMALDPAVRYGTILHWEVYDPPGEAPPNVEVHDDDWGCPDNRPHLPMFSNCSREAYIQHREFVALWEEVYGPAEQWHIARREEWERLHGWDGEYDRCERVVATDYRCERCRDLADSIEELGYCTIHPGNLIDAHIEFIEEHGLTPMVWRADANGVFNPVRLTKFEIARRNARIAYRRTLYEARWWVLRQYWKWSYRLQQNQRVMKAMARYKAWKSLRKQGG